MLKQLVETARKYPLLKHLLCFHALVIAALAALYYLQAEPVLWDAQLYVPIIKDDAGNWRYQKVAHGPSLLLPWHLLPQHVFWLGLDILVFGSLTIWCTWRIAGRELRNQVADREKAAAAKLLEAEEESAAAGRRMREAEAWEQRLKARESQLEARESEVVNREVEAQALWYPKRRSCFLLWARGFRLVLRLYARQCRRMPADAGLRT